MYPHRWFLIAVYFHRTRRMVSFGSKLHLPHYTVTCGRRLRPTSGWKLLPTKTAWTNLRMDGCKILEPHLLSCSLWGVETRNITENYNLESGIIICKKTTVLRKKNMICSGNMIKSITKRRRWSCLWSILNPSLQFFPTNFLQNKLRFLWACKQFSSDWYFLSLR